jgi:hypothetical protein
MCDVPGPSTAGVIALNAIGGQDVHLVTDDVEKSIFKYDEIRHTDYTRFYRTTRIDNRTKQKYWPFGQEGNIIKVTLNPQSMGDLLANMYLMIELPRSIYSRYVGNSIIKSIAFKVDGIEVEKIFDDWQVIYNEMYLETSEQAANDYLLNRMMFPVDWRRNDEKARLNAKGAFSTIPTLIPLRFFFSRKYAQSEYDVNKPNRPYLPLCAMYKQKIILEIEFHSIWFFSKPTTSYAISEPKFLRATDFDFPTLNEFKIITEEITLSPEDRLFYVKEKYDLLANLVFKNPIIESTPGDPIIKNNLTPSIPVKAIHWFVRRKKFEYELPVEMDIRDSGFPREYSNTYVSDGVNLIDSRFRFERIKNAKIFLNSLDLPNVSLADHKYFKYYIPLQSRLTCPQKNIYTYSFAMTPINSGPTGTLDFSNFNSDKTFLNVEMYGGNFSVNGYRINLDGIVDSNVERLSETYILYIYYTGLKMFSFENGFMSEAT